MAKTFRPSADRIIKAGLVSKGVSPADPYFAGKLIFFRGWCKRCGLCTVVCPVGALRQAADGAPYLDDPQQCRECGLCCRICPDFAIVKNPDIDVSKGHADGAE